MLQDPVITQKQHNSDMFATTWESVLFYYKERDQIHFTFSTRADLIPTANSLSSPPKNPTGPAYIPLSNDSERQEMFE